MLFRGWTRCHLHKLMQSKYTHTHTHTCMYTNRCEKKICIKKERYPSEKERERARITVWLRDGGKKCHIKILSRRFDQRWEHQVKTWKGNKKNCFQFIHVVVIVVVVIASMRDQADEYSNNHNNTPLSLIFRYYRLSVQHPIGIHTVNSLTPHHRVYFLWHLIFTSHKLAANTHRFNYSKRIQINVMGANGWKTTNIDDGHGHTSSTKGCMYHWGGANRRQAHETKIKIRAFFPFSLSLSLSTAHIIRISYTFSLAFSIYTFSNVNVYVVVLLSSSSTARGYIQLMFTICVENRNIWLH